MATTTNTQKEQKFKEWFINSKHNTSEGSYRYTTEPNMFTVRFIQENKVMRFVPNGKSYKAFGA